MSLARPSRSAPFDVRKTTWNGLSHGFVLFAGRYSHHLSSVRKQSCEVAVLHHELDLAKCVVKIATDELHIPPGQPFPKLAILKRLGGDRPATSAVVAAESRGWIKSLSGEYCELTRRGYVEGWLEIDGYRDNPYW